jgi:hypothetical protein
MNIKTITNEYFQKIILTKIKLSETDNYTMSRNAIQIRREAKRDAINSLVDLNYSLRDCLNIIDNYWPVQYNQIKHKFGITTLHKNELRSCTDPNTYREVLINRQILACAYLEQQINEQE